MHIAQMAGEYCKHHTIYIPASMLEPLAVLHCLAKGHGELLKILVKGEANLIHRLSVAFLLRVWPGQMLPLRIQSSVALSDPHTTCDT